MTSHTVPDDAVPPLRLLEVARSDLAERARVHVELRAAHDALHEAQAEHQRLRDVLTSEELDVGRLEGRSASRVWSSLRGSRERDLEREREQARTAAAAVEVQARTVELLREVTESLARRAEALEHAERDYQSALERVAGSGGTVDDAHVAAAVQELAHRRELQELEQASAAGRSALQGLVAARQTLGSADSWSSWDTFGGGGMLSSAMKHERLDEARQRLEVAGEALTRFTRELDDLRMPGIALPEFSGLVRGVDIWWDNVGVDLLVRDRIKRTQRDVDAAVARVEEALATLETRRQQLVG
jgi:hypothetical protein